MNKKKIFTYIIAGIVLLVMAVFIILPLQTAKLHIKVYFEETSGHQCNIYYETTSDPGFSEEKTVFAPIENGMADLVVDATLADTLSGLRFDFPAEEDRAVVTRVELTSGGFIQKSYDGTEFFAPATFLMTQGISAIDPLEGYKAVVVTTSDPAVVFGEGRLAEVRDSFSHYTVTKAVACIFILLTCVFARKKLFADVENEF